MFFQIQEVIKQWIPTEMTKTKGFYANSFEVVSSMFD